MDNTKDVHDTVTFVRPDVLPPDPLPPLGRLPLQQPGLLTHTAAAAVAVHPKNGGSGGNKGSGPVMTGAATAHGGSAMQAATAAAAKATAVAMEAAQAVQSNRK